MVATHMVDVEVEADTVSILTIMEKTVVPSNVVVVAAVLLPVLQAFRRVRAAAAVEAGILAATVVGTKRMVPAAATTATPTKSPAGD